MKTITMSTHGNNGRLGNQLFQLASMIGLSKQYGAKLVLPDWKYKQYFNTEPFVTYLKEDETLYGIEAKETTFHYVPDWPVIKDEQVIDIWGYLQSYKYWQHNTDDIKKALTFNEEFKIQTLTAFGFGEFKNPIALSIRRGDYIDNPNYELLPIVSYYFEALETQFPTWKDRDIIVFSDDIPYCKVHFGSYKNIHFSENNSEIEDLCLLSQCDDHIIGNSTFAFWGAYLADRGKVIRPVHHFAGKLKAQNDIKDYYPNEWIPFDHKSNELDRRIDLMDVTFTIPVSYDHPDRDDNLKMVIRNLRKYFRTNIIVMEHSVDDKRYWKDLLTGKDSRHGGHFQVEKYMEMQGPYFHRTKMLNDMMHEATTPYVFNWDADVIVPPLQLVQAVEILRSGTKAVFPYKWAFARMPRNQWFERIRNYEDIGLVGSTQFNGMNTSDVVSVGGAFGFDKKWYASIGGENENFVSYGAEDRERVFRISILNYKIGRADGPCLYHMNHWVGNNSSNNHPHVAQNDAEERRLKAMPYLELEKYIITWPWKK